MSEIIESIEQLVKPSLENAQVELVDLTYQKSPNGWTLCFYLDKAGGVTLEDCSFWSDKLGNILEEANLIPHSYSLEVSSPGLYRPLKKTKDYERFTGERVEVRLYAPLNGQKNFQGQLLGIRGDIVQLSLDDRREISLPVQQIAKSNLIPNIEI